MIIDDGHVYGQTQSIKSRRRITLSYCFDWIIISTTEAVVVVGASPLSLICTPYIHYDIFAYTRHYRFPNSNDRGGFDPGFCLGGHSDHPLAPLSNHYNSTGGTWNRRLLPGERYTFQSGIEFPKPGSFSSRWILLSSDWLPTFACHITIWQIGNSPLAALLDANHYPLSLL